MPKFYLCLALVVSPMFYRKTLFIIFLLKGLCGAAQNNSGVFALRYHWGSFLTIEPKTQYLQDSYAQFTELQWQHSKLIGAKQNIRWGTSLFFGNSGSSQHLGKIGGAFASIAAPIKQKQKWLLNFRAGAGIGYVQKPYQKMTNFKNVVIGTHLNAFLHVGVENSWHLTNQFQLLAGVSFSHLSNGATRLPNLGLNIPAFTLGVLYQNNNKNAAAKIEGPTPSSKKIAWLLYSGAGTTQRPFVGSKQYTVFVAQAEAGRQTAAGGAAISGVAFFYNPALHVPNPDLGDTLQRSESQVALYAGYRFILTKHFSFPVQAGVYLYNAANNPAVYQQIGVRYSLGRHVFTGLHLKTHGGKADYIHAGIGYQF